jgi:hypothetical protein
MPHLTTLRCRACRAPLASSDGGSLAPLVPVERVRPDGAVVLRCGCGERWVWAPARTLATVVLS